MSLLFDLLPNLFGGSLSAQEQREVWEGFERESRSTVRRETVPVATRMKDVGLLASAFDDLGARITTRLETRIVADVAGDEVTMTQRADGIWQARFVRQGSEMLRDEAHDFITQLDAAYAKRVQAVVAERRPRRSSLLAPSCATSMSSRRALPLALLR